jgi:hypothetical protein
MLLICVSASAVHKAKCQMQYKFSFLGKLISRFLSFIATLFQSVWKQISRWSKKLRENHKQISMFYAI